MADTRPSPAAAAATAGTEAREANSHIHIAQSRTTQRHVKKVYQRRNRKHSDKPSQTSTPEVVSPTITTREEKTGGGFILQQQGTSYRHSEEVYG